VLGPANEPALDGEESDVIVEELTVCPTETNVEVRLELLISPDRVLGRPYGTLAPQRSGY